MSVFGKTFDKLLLKKIQDIRSEMQREFGECPTPGQQIDFLVQLVAALSLIVDGQAEEAAREDSRQVILEAVEAARKMIPKPL